MNIFRKRREHPGVEALSEYLSGRLAPGEARRVETHVDACAACREELDSLGYTVGLMRRVPMVPPRTTFVLSQAPTEGVPRGWASGIPGWAYGAAASVAAVVFVVVLSADMGGLLTEDAVTGAQDSPAAVDAPPPVLEAAPAGIPVPESTGEGAEDQPIGPIGTRGEAEDEALEAVSGVAAGGYEGALDPASETPTPAAMAMASQDAPAMAEPEPSPGPTPAAALAKAVEEPAVTPAPAATVAVAPKEIAEPEGAAEAVEVQAAAPARSVEEPAVAEATPVPAAEAAEPLESPEVADAEALVGMAAVDITTTQPVEDGAPEPTPPDTAEPDTPTSTPAAAPADTSVERDETAGPPVMDEADALDGIVAPEMEEDEAATPAPSEPAQPATRAPSPTPQVVRVPEAAPTVVMRETTAATRGTTSFLWRVVEGAAAALVLVAGGMFLWVRRRRAA